MKKKVLIISFDKDIHALAIQSVLKNHNAEADIIDTAMFPQVLNLSASYAGQHMDVVLDGKPLADYHSVWWRRVTPPTPAGDITDAEERRYAARECREALWGAIHASGIPIYNNPKHEQIANYKPYQLKVAQSCDLPIPDTLITNSKQEALHFIKNHKQVVYKGFSGTSIMMTDTRPLREEDLNDLWRIKYSPVIFQEYLELAKEYRITVIEDDVFATEIKINNPKAKYDWRLDQKYEVIQTDMAEEIKTKLCLLVKKLGLHSGSIDLRETPDGKIYFLEINPAGQFLFLDVFAGTDVANRFCELLLK